MADISIRGADIKVVTRFGELHVDPSQVITFPRGIPGFEKDTRWKLFHEVDEHGNWVSGVIVHLQSLDDNEVTLALTDPTMFGFNYELVLSDSEVAELKLEDPSDVLVLVGLAAKGGGPASTNMYANISAPFLINTKSLIGMQKVLVGKESKIGFRPLVTTLNA